MLPAAAVSPRKLPFSVIASRCLLGAALIAAFITACSGSGSVLYGLTNLRQRCNVTFWRDMDNALIEASGGGDAVLVLPDDAVVRRRTLSADAYYRGCYVLYPHQVFAAANGKLLYVDEDLQQFVSRRGIGAVLKVSASPTTGQTVLSLVRLQQPPAGGGR